MSPKAGLAKSFVSAFLLLFTILSSSPVLAKSVATECAKVATCVANLASYASTCGNSCVFGINPDQSCVECLSNIGSGVANEIQQCLRAVRDCDRAFDGPETPPACSRECVSCCSRGAEAYCRANSGIPNCLDRAYSGCFKSCSCRGGTDLPPDRPRFGENPVCMSRPRPGALPDLPRPVTEPNKKSSSQHDNEPAVLGK